MEQVMITQRERRRAARARRAFTLIEMLVTIGIIALLLSLLAPALKTFQAESRSAACMSHLRQLHSGIEGHRAAHKDLLPMCDFVPVVTPNGPQGGLPDLLKGYVPKDCDCWRCPADFDEDESLATGASYTYVPGLLRWSPQVQFPVQQAMLSYILDPGMSEEMKDALRLEAETRLVTRFYESNAGLFPVLSDSQDRHDYGDRHPKNALYLDGSARIIDTKPATAAPTTTE